MNTEPYTTTTSPGRDDQLFTNQQVSTDTTRAVNSFATSHFSDLQDQTPHPDQQTAFEAQRFDQGGAAESNLSESETRAQAIFAPPTHQPQGITMSSVLGIPSRGYPMPPLFFFEEFRPQALQLTFSPQIGIGQLPDLIQRLSAPGQLYQYQSRSFNMRGTMPFPLRTPLGVLGNRVQRNSLGQPTHSSGSMEHPEAPGLNGRAPKIRSRPPGSDPYRQPSTGARRRPSALDDLAHFQSQRSEAGEQASERLYFWLDTHDWKFKKEIALAQCLRCENRLVLPTPSAIAFHERTHNPSGPFLCGLEGCVSGFPSLRSRSSHISSRHGGEEICSFCFQPIEIPQSGGNFDSAYQKHLLSHHLSVTSWKCTECIKFKGSESDLHAHYKRKHKSAYTTPQALRLSFIDQDTGLPLNPHYISVNGSTIIAAYSKDQQPEQPNPVTWTLDVS